MGKLTDLANKYGTDKGTSADGAHGYTKVYEKLLPKKINKMAEIGVLSGASLLMWKNYYPKAEIHALDWFKDPRSVTPDWCVENGFTPHEINVKHSVVFGQLDQFDLVIEDSSHNSQDQVKIFAEFFIYNLAHGGLYVCEDAESCCKEEFYRNGKCLTYENTICGMMKGYLSTGIISNPAIKGSIAKRIQEVIEKVEFHCDDNLIFIWKKC